MDISQSSIISPGLPATTEGLKLAVRCECVRKAQKIEADLIYGRFSWGIDEDKLTVEHAIAVSHSSSSVA